MGTIVTIDVRDDGAEDAIARAFEWFRDVERRCNRFDPSSELRALTAQPGVAVPASDLVYSAVEFALAVAEETGGAFDPTVGGAMEARGFNRDYRSGETITSGIDAGAPVTYRDVELDPARRTIRLRQPLVLDLGAVVKGLAIDSAVRELAPFGNFAIDAGGDLYMAGRDATGEPWTVGIRHPRRDREVIETLRVSDAAVCTSGDYERQGTTAEAGHHILDPRNGTSAGVVVSATVVAPTAMVADALATAAFVLGPDEGIRLLERHGVNGVLISPDLTRIVTRGFYPAILPDA